MAVMAVAISACYRPEISDCSKACGWGDSCPSGMTCSQGKCATTGRTCPPADASPGDDAADARGEHEADADASLDVSADGGEDAAPDVPEAGDMDAPADVPEAGDMDAPADVPAAGGEDAPPDSPNDKTGGPDGGDAPPACPPGRYRNVVRNVCVPAGDLNGDGRADFLAVNRTDHHALISGGTGLSFVKWFDGEFHGAGGVCAADVTGDGYADGVSFGVDATAVVSRGNAGFGNPRDDRSVWSQVSLLGTKGTFLADVDGDRRADVVSVFERTLVVARSRGTAFEAPMPWLTDDLIDVVAVFVADADGNEMADVIAVRPGRTDVLLSTGEAFRPAASWRQSRFVGVQGTFFADIDGDGRTDGVRLENDSVWVMRAIPDAFGTEERWFDGPLHGPVATFVADANGDGRADVVALNRTGVKVAFSTGTGFSAPVTWYAGQFSSEVNLTVVPHPAAPCAFADPTTVGVFGPDEKWWLRSSNGPGGADVTFAYGGGTDVPVVGDWDGDGITTIGVYRPPSSDGDAGWWFLRNENSGGWWDVPEFAYGGPGDIPVVGDWNGDGTTTIGVYRPPHSVLNQQSFGIWLLRNSNDGGPWDIPVDYGEEGELPVVGDWNGDGDADIGLFRPSDSRWRMWSDADRFALFYGDDPSDLPIAGDWDGDGTDTVGVVRPANTLKNPTELNRWRLRNHNAPGSADVDFFFGVAGAIPVAGKWSSAAARAPAR
jgi:hypothetical protein